MYSPPGSLQPGRALSERQGHQIAGDTLLCAFQQDSALAVCEDS